MALPATMGNVSEPFAPVPPSTSWLKCLLTFNSMCILGSSEDQREAFRWVQNHIAKFGKFRETTVNKYML